MKKIENKENEIFWEKDIPLINNFFILKDNLLISFFSVSIFQILIFLMVFLIEKDPFDVLLPLPFFLLAVFSIFLIFCFSMLLLGNSFRLDFKINEKGVSYEAGPREKKINRFVLILMLLTKPPQSGAGFLAISEEVGSYSWDEIYKVIPHPSRRVIEYKNSWRTLVRAYCNDDNFERVLNFSNEMLSHNLEKRDNLIIHKKKPLYFYLLWILSSTIFTILSLTWYPIEYGKSMIQIIILCGGMTLFSGLFFRRIISKIFSSLSILGGFYFVYQLLIMGLEKSESIFSEIRYAYQFDQNLFFLTLMGSLILLFMNFYVLSSDKY